MKQVLLSWILSALAIWIVSQIVPGFVVEGVLAALFAAIVIGFINGTLGLVLKIATFPFALLTLGLFSLVLNALLIWLASALSFGFHIESFWAAFLGAIVLSLINMVLQPLAKAGD